MKARSLAFFATVSVSFNVWALPGSHSPFFPEEDYTLSLGSCSTSRDVTNNHPPEGCGFVLARSPETEPDYGGRSLRGKGLQRS